MPVGGDAAGATNACTISGLEKKPNLKSSCPPALTRATIYNVNVFA